MLPSADCTPFTLYSALSPFSLSNASPIALTTGMKSGFSIFDDVTANFLMLSSPDSTFFTVYETLIALSFSNALSVDSAIGMKFGFLMLFAVTDKR